MARPHSGDQRRIDYDIFLKLKSKMDGEQEIELKFLASPEGIAAALKIPVLAPLRQAPARPQVSTYYDTPDRALQKSGFILRLRDVDGGVIQTVKQEGAALARGEWEAALDTHNLDLDRAAQTPLGKLLADQEIRARIGPLFTTRVNRRKAEAPFAHAMIEVVIDEGEVVAGEAHAPILEIELELKAGRRSGLFALARKLARDAPVSLSLISKGERGYRLSEGVWGAPVKMTPPPLDAKMSAAEAFAAIAHGCLRQMMLNAPAFENGQEVEAVHQTRVAIRRLRAALALFRPVIMDKTYPALAADLKWLSDRLGDTRDIDVLLTETVQPALAREPDAPGLAELATVICARQATSRRLLREAMASPRGRKLMLDLLVWVEDGPWRRQAMALKAEPENLKHLLSRRLKGSRRKLAALGENLETLPEAQMHEVRIRAKKLRYQAIFFDTLASQGKCAKRFRAFVDALEQIQETLGAVHDAETTAAFLEEQARQAVQLGESHDPLVLFAAGRLAGAHPDREALVRRAGKALTKALAAKPFWTKL
jgi:inorganic triphosphatase YgiF